MVGARAAVVHRGAAHWLSRSKLAIKAAGGVPYLCVRRDGRLSVARVHPTRVDFYTQQDGDDDGGDMVTWLRDQMFGKEWLLDQVIQMPVAVPAGANFRCCSWFHFSKGAMVAVYGGHGVFSLDLETKAMEKIMDLSSCGPSRGYYSCLPYEMDLPQFFIGRLGGRETEKQVGLTVGSISSLILQFTTPDASLLMRD
ncbi:hypothetical protein BAE44_0002725 [Dichanthelium oligosanthes]|uniref:Uncharacterized protein n=1 Tax=Dichanthelium oligosanthes TaxID=888268 RepID=A0A1E5WG06_9POAL|nr:hypothetical protein BAE44_0002725 [Dichanthelium oligosanthes]